MFGILIVAMMLANYLAVQFPAQEQAVEYQHTLQVGNQFLQLQSAIQAEVQHPSQPIVLTTPITLSDAGVPPLGPPRGSEFVAQPSSVDNAAYTVRITSGTTKTYSEGNFGGISDTILDAYQPQVTYTYEEGAVVASGTSGSSTMLQGPAISVLPTIGGGYSVNVTLVQLQPVNLTIEQGSGTIGVETWLISESTLSLSKSSPGSTGFSGTQWFNISTTNPTAWTTWAASLPDIFPTGAVESGCYTYQVNQQVCTISMAVVDTQLTLVQATVGITLVG